jgi:hypothetical protein
MQDSRFWKVIAVVVCLGLFYVGHGLHNRGGDPLPSLANAAHAGVASLDGKLYTTGQDGLTVHVWVIDPSDGGKPRYMPSLMGTAGEGRRDNRPSQKP